MPIKDPVQLNEAQNIVFANKAYWPNAGQTFCNEATQDVLNRLGYNALNGMLADIMYKMIAGASDWKLIAMEDAQAIANAGTILVATLPSYKLGQLDGHICTLTPGQAVDSGHWGAMAPMCMNLGRVGTCFRKIGINYAFIPEPEIYALISTL